MKLLILGGSGGTGSQIVTQALAAGHEATVLARQRSKVTTQHPRLRVIEGSVDGSQALTEAIQGQDAVLSAIGRGKSFKSENLIEHCVTAILNAMKQNGIQRLLFTSALGVGDSYGDSPILAKLFFRTLLRGIYADKLVGDDMIRKSGLDWTIVQPVALTDGPLTKVYRAGAHLALTGMPSISRADTAHYILDHVNDTSTFGKTIVLAK
ncbi:MAG: NAD(P)-binding oxidoreductase [Acidobacteriota bacterium]